jgi:essential nuclear protein 1
MLRKGELKNEKKCNLNLVSIPQMHAAAAILSIAEMDYNCANSYIMRILVEKNFTLPFRVLDGLVFHFLKLFFYWEKRLILY